MGVRYGGLPCALLLPGLACVVCALCGQVSTCKGCGGTLVAPPVAVPYATCGDGAGAVRCLEACSPAAIRAVSALKSPGRDKLAVENEYPGRVAPAALPVPYTLAFEGCGGTMAAAAAPPRYASDGFSLPLDPGSGAWGRVAVR